MNYEVISQSSGTYSSVGRRIGSRMQEVPGPNPRLGGLRVSQFQASGGISTLQSRASGLQSTTQRNSIRTTKRRLPVRKKDRPTGFQQNPGGGSADKTRSDDQIIREIRISGKALAPVRPRMPAVGLQCLKAPDCC